MDEMEKWYGWLKSDMGDVKVVWMRLKSDMGNVKVIWMRCKSDMEYEMWYGW